MTKIKFSKENKSVIIPSREEGNAGFDLYVDKEWLEKEHGGFLEIKPNTTVMLPTGLRSIIKNKWYAQIQERGSTGVKGMKYGAGVIDASYRGIWNVVITNSNNVSVLIYDEDKYKKDDYDTRIWYPSSKGIAQFVLIKVPKVKIEEVSVDDVLNDKTHRGEGKLGSSGK